jgi:FkbM family methyltransferase
VDLGAILRRSFGAKGGLSTVPFRQGGQSIECDVPDDSIWIAVKDDLILREYERVGIDLGAVRGTVIDAGAHAGMFTLQVAVNAEKVIALEPHPMMQNLLRRNIQHKHLQNMEALPSALWVGRDEIGLFQGAHSGATSVFGSGQPTYRVKPIPSRRWSKRPTMSSFSNSTSNARSSECSSSATKRRSLTFQPSLQRSSLTGGHFCSQL